MSEKFAGKFDAFGRVGIRDKNTHALLRVYPEVVSGTDEQIENTVKDWYCNNSKGKEIQINNCYVDTLSPIEWKHAEEKFKD